jgi:hypothetical protein
VKPLPTISLAPTATWVALVLLTLVSYSLGDAPLGRGVPTPILAGALVKASLVGFMFMELRAAHVVWKVAFMVLLLTLGIALCLLRLAPG